MLIPWRNALLAVPLLWAFAACGNDEGLGNSGDNPSASAGSGGSGVLLEAGASPGGAASDAASGAGSGPIADGGESGSEPTPSGSAGTNGLAGSGTGPLTGSGGDGDGPGPAHGTSTLGGPCSANAQCVAGLSCLSAGGDELGERSPPHGLCTKACANDDDCTPYGAGSLCYPLGADGDQGYCVEGCAFGDAQSAKCHDRLDFSCMPALLFDSSVPCSSTSDCAPGDLCSNGTCSIVLAGCLPACRGDLDCPSGSACDQSFLSGMCTTVKQTGKPLGAPCSVPGAGAAAEPDECLGFCQSDDGGQSGHCAGTCGLGNACGWNPTSEKYDGVCLYASVLTADIGVPGDFGFCTPSCNCSDDCQDSTLECTELGAGPLGSDFSGAGLCFTKAPGTTPLEDCP